MVGLAGPRTRQKIAHDPRNTSWSNDTDRFGHRHLSTLGWKPGTGLGLSAATYSITTHIKIRLKDDNLGLGATTAKANQDANNWAPGLDSFQELLSRLNSGTNTPSNVESSSENSDIDKETMWERETTISQSYNRRKWGARIKFVKGERLGATIDKHSLQLDRKEQDEVTVNPGLSNSNAIETGMHQKDNKNSNADITSTASEDSNISTRKKAMKSSHHSKSGRKRKHNDDEHEIVTDADEKTLPQREREGNLDAKEKKEKKRSKVEKREVEVLIEKEDKEERKRHRKDKTRKKGKKDRKMDGKKNEQD
ncbi:hypothetical protein V1509DRAFT_600281 [Lipomyces kononenkoae]